MSKCLHTPHRSFSLDGAGAAAQAAAGMRSRTATMSLVAGAAVSVCLYKQLEGVSSSGASSRYTPDAVVTGLPVSKLTAVVVDGYGL